MTPDQAGNAQNDARKALDEVGRIRADTDNRVLAAYMLGIRKTEIAARTTMSRSTIDRIISNRKRGR